MSIIVKNKPVSPLPWTHIPWMVTSADEVIDAAHVVHAVNAYPHLVSALVNITRNAYDAGSKGRDALAAGTKLLRELAEL